MCLYYSLICKKLGLAFFFSVLVTKTLVETVDEMTNVVIEMVEMFNETASMTFQISEMLSKHFSHVSYKDLFPKQGNTFPAPRGGVSYHIVQK